MTDGTKRQSITLTDEEAKALREAADSLGMDPEELIRTFLMRGLQASAGLLREGQEAGLSNEQITERSIRAYIAFLPTLPPEDLRFVSRVYEKIAREQVGQGMAALRERIRNEKGPIPDITALIDEGRDSS